MFKSKHVYQNVKNYFTSVFSLRALLLVSQCIGEFYLYNGSQYQQLEMRDYKNLASSVQATQVLKSGSSNLLLFWILIIQPWTSYFALKLR